MTFLKCFTPKQLDNRRLIHGKGKVVSVPPVLTFHAAETAFERYGVEFSVEKYRALGITQNDIYTNLALLLSDQCHHTILVETAGLEPVTSCM